MRNHGENRQSSFGTNLLTSCFWIKLQHQIISKGVRGVMVQGHGHIGLALAAASFVVFILKRWEFQMLKVPFIAALLLVQPVTGVGTTHCWRPSWNGES